MFPFACHANDDKIDLDTGDWVMISVLAFFGILIAIGTLTDLAIVFMEFDKLPVLFVQLFQNFSLYHNTRKILDMSTGSDNLTCINGIRLIMFPKSNWHIHRVSIYKSSLTPIS